MLTVIEDNQGWVHTHLPPDAFSDVLWWPVDNDCVHLCEPQGEAISWGAISLTNMALRIQNYLDIFYQVSQHTAVSSWFQNESGVESVRNLLPPHILHFCTREVFSAECDKFIKRKNFTVGPFQDDFLVHCSMIYPANWEQRESFSRVEEMKGKSYAGLSHIFEHF